MFTLKKKKRKLERGGMISVFIYIKGLKDRGIRCLLYGRSYRERKFVSTYMSIGEGNGTPLQYSCLENPMDGGAMVLKEGMWNEIAFSEGKRRRSFFQAAVSGWEKQRNGYRMG